MRSVTVFAVPDPSKLQTQLANWINRKEDRIEIFQKLDEKLVFIFDCSFRDIHKYPGLASRVVKKKMLHHPEQIVSSLYLASGTL